MSDATYIAGIGFSAGGLDPLRKFFDCTLHDSVTYVIVQHLPVNYRTNLAMILSKHSSLKILEVENGMPVRKDAIYVTPASAYIEVAQGRFKTVARPAGRPYPNESVDKFFSSLAMEKRRNAIGIVLSGGGEDGLDGSKLIKQMGGLIVVQQPAEASQPSMPQAIIDHGLADFISEVEKIPAIIRKHVTASVEQGMKRQNH